MLALGWLLIRREKRRRLVKIVRAALIAIVQRIFSGGIAAFIPNIIGGHRANHIGRCLVGAAYLGNFIGYLGGFAFRLAFVGCARQVAAFMRQGAQRRNLGGGGFAQFICGPLGKAFQARTNIGGKPYERRPESSGDYTGDAIFLLR